jgi:hypothetical protein
MKAHPPISGFRLKIRCCIANFHLFFLIYFTAEKVFPNSEAKVNISMLMPPFSKKASAGG